MGKEKKLQVEKFDSAMKTGSAGKEEVRWYSADDTPLRLTGFYFRKKGGVFRRFPEDKKLPSGVDGLSWHTAGGQLSFKTDSPFVRIKVELWHESLMDHCTKIGSSGFDLYWGKPGEKVFVGVTRIKVSDNAYDLNLVAELPKKMREYTLHFPLYCGVESFALGLAPDAKVAAPSKWTDERPVVVYGTSITQGGCANRPGMAYTNILSRKFNIPFLNFGFSGSGRGEACVFEQLAKIKNPRMFLLDYEANSHEAGIKATLAAGIDILRKAHPDTPIMVLSAARFNAEIRETGSTAERTATMERCWKFQKAEVARRRRAGDKNITFVYGGWPNMPDWPEFTVDGCHGTDLGFYMQAKMLEPKIRKFLKIEK